MSKKILLTAYDIDPYKGSESTTGWNFPIHIAQACEFDITVVTRCNNQKNIDKFFSDNPELKPKNLTYQYFDLPYKYRFWKRGSRGATLYYYLWQYFVVGQFFRLGEFDAVHSLNFHTDALPSFLWRTNKPFFWGPISHHEPIPNKFLKIYPKKEAFKEHLKALVKKALWSFDPFLKQCARRSTTIFLGHSKVPSKLGLNGDSKCIQMNQVAVSSRHQVVAKKRCKSDRSFKFITIGRSVPLKGFDLVVEAFNQLIQQDISGMNYKLIVIGDGPYLNTLKHLAGSSPHVEFTKWVTHDKVFDYLSESDVFVFPSHEGAGMVVAEAASFGLPIICLDNYGPGELMPEGYPLKIESSLTREQIISRLTDTMVNISKNDELYNDISSEMVDHYLTHFTWESKAQRIVDAYKKVL